MCSQTVPAPTCVTWQCDGSSTVVYGKSGSVVHNYTGVGDKIIHGIAEDK